MNFTASIMRKMTAGKVIMTCFILLSAMVGNDLSAQTDKFSLYPTLGVTWRSAPITLERGPNEGRTGTPSLYDLESNVQGLSLNIGLQAQYGVFGVEYYPNLRYDAIHVSQTETNVDVKEFIIDHNFNLFLKFNKLSYGIGMTLVNPGKSYYYYGTTIIDFGDVYYDEIDFNTYNVFVSIPIKEVIQLEINALYAPHSPDIDSPEKSLMFSLRVYYKFYFLNKKG